ncbi:hypothetical protein H0H92_008677 [Tricholoma furcatifolium]|nr:hypothetical protein H0H92_008677 [Tricholoma furcatifolium]
MLLPRLTSPGKITTENFHEHLGDDDAYLEYFTEVVKNLGVSEAVEEHIFSPKANFIPGKKKGEQPEMLGRFMDGIIHSLIHVGYGLEFNVPGLVAEGLAWTAVHVASSPAVIPSSLWTTPVDNPTLVTSLMSRFSGLKLGPGTDNVSDPSQENIHALTILARILKDSRFDAIPSEELWYNVYSNIDTRHGDAVADHVRAWSFNHNSPKEIERKIEELVYANSLIYAVAGWSKDEEFNADFFHVHIVTSALFLGSIVEVLKPSSQEIFLRSYFAVCLTWWIGRGRPGFDISAFYANTSTNPGPVPPFPAPREDALPSPDSPKASNPNAWFQLLQDALVVPDDHFPKIFRSLAHFSELYGARRAGLDDFATTELPGAEIIDGTLFLRAAVLTNSKLRIDRNVDVTDSKYWDRKGFYKAQ